ncbi:MAG: type II toxin-antitoxin system Phd/YefM family antitoxin [Proteobacteria bacterium]|nr:type II toxin-antitoxin system Phd/YefM family antitoxin [Pseudomonadota bacterium]
MHQVNIHEAKTQLSKLIQEAIEGQEVIIARGNKPVVRLEVLPEARLKRRIGGAKNLIIDMSDDFNEPLEDFEEYVK